MNYEANRLSTFANWPSSAPVDPIRIAKAGFFYIGQGLEVQCFSCGGKITEWSYGDQVMARHRRLDANCPFVLNPQRTGNVPLVLETQPASQPGLLPERPDSHINHIDHSDNYGVTEEDELYRTDALRHLSFVNWDDSSVSQESLIRAGFYHAGGGRLRCAWCGGELARMRRLAALGDPLDVHLRYFPGCPHAARVLAQDEASRAAASSALNAIMTQNMSPNSEAQQQTPNNTTPRPQSDVPQTSAAVHNARVLSGCSTWRTLGVVSGGGARRPERACPAARLETFHAWPKDRSQTPQALVDAGFYYAGADDQVRCFYCDGGLGKWERGDDPWREHARWFPHCGYVLLVRGADFVDSCRDAPVTRTYSADAGLTARRASAERRPIFPVTDSQVCEQMESEMALAALGAGLDAARVRRAITTRLRATGLPFRSSEALIDAVLDSQLGEEPWPTAGHALRDFTALDRLIPSIWNDRSVSQQSESDSSPPRNRIETTPNRNTSQPQTTLNQENNQSVQSENQVPSQSPRTNGSSSQIKDESKATSPSPETKKISLEEENRQLKEARLCKVCMDNEVCVVFLPCGHLVSCAWCGAGLRACPLCRADVTALVRAYLA